jgi:hypothetical protein
MHMQVYTADYFFVLNDTVIGSRRVRLVTGQAIQRRIASVVLVKGPHT